MLAAHMRRRSSSSSQRPMKSLSRLDVLDSRAKSINSLKDLSVSMIEVAIESAIGAGFHLRLYRLIVLRASTSAQTALLSIKYRKIERANVEMTFQ